MFKSLKNQEIPHSCSYKGCLTLFKSLDKEYKNSLFDLEEMLQIEALEDLSIISVLGQVFLSRTWWMRMIVNKIFLEVSRDVSLFSKV